MVLSGLGMPFKAAAVEVVRRPLPAFVFELIEVGVVAPTASGRKNKRGSQKLSVAVE